MNNFTLRAISAAVYVSVISVCLLLGEWATFGLFFIITFFCLKEYQSIVLKEIKTFQKWIFVMAGLYIFSLTALWHFKYLNQYYYGACLLLVISLFVIELFQKNKMPFDQIGKQLTGFIYIPVSIGLLFGLGFQEFLYQNGEITYNGLIVLMVFVMIWANDTFAYLSGRWLGKRPLFSRISPKKTIEGTIGGILLTMVASMVIHYFVPQFSVTEYLILALSISIFATIGDLVESMLKRSYDIKDSGQLIPGHGGILDRMDASLITAWFVYFLFKIF